MKPCTTITGALGVSIAAGLAGAAVATILLMAFARPWVGIGAVVTCLVAGFFTLLVKYPRWEADI